MLFTSKKAVQLHLVKEIMQKDFKRKPFDYSH